MGLLRGMVFPILSPTNATMPFRQDWSTAIDRTESRITIKSITPKCPKPSIRIDDSKDYECKIVLSDDTVVLGRPDIVVIDDSMGRRIELQSTERIDQMIEETRTNRYPIRYTCKSKDKMCRAFLVWAKKQEKS